MISGTFHITEIIDGKSIFSKKNLISNVHKTSDGNSKIVVS